MSQHTDTGLVLVECDVETRHEIYARPDEYGCPVSCPACEAEIAWERVVALEAANERRRHRRHFGAHWWITRRLAGWAYQLGLIASYSRTWSSEHRGCVNNPRLRGHRSYLLGWPVWKWKCVRRGHWPGEDIGLDACGKCLPCPECGSTTAGHTPDCDGTR